MVIKISTVQEASFSDHRPKMMQTRVRIRKWRNKGAEKRRPNMKHEALRVQEIAQDYKEKTRTRIVEARERGLLRENGMNWDIMADIMIKCIRETCGTRGRKINDPWTVGHEEEMEEMRVNISRLVIERDRLSAQRRTRAREREIKIVKYQLKEERRRKKGSLRTWRRQWWDSKITECEEANQNGYTGKMYRLLREIGVGQSDSAPPTTTVSTGEFKEHFESLTAERFERESREVEEVVKSMADLRGNQEAQAANDRMNVIPSEEEIMKAIEETKDSAPGEDGIRISYIKQADQEILRRIIDMVRFMFTHGAEQWDEGLKVGLMCPIFKKGNRGNTSNYRGICLLAMGSLILARVIASRISSWAEELRLLDENQAGFWQDSSTADATQVIVRIQEDVSEYRKRREQQRERAEEREEMIVEARLLDLEKSLAQSEQTLPVGYAEEMWPGGAFPEDYRGLARNNDV